MINGSIAVFQCEASAVPEHDVFWTFTNSDGSTLSIISTAGSDTDKYQIKQMRGAGAGFGELTVVDVQYEDRGRYTCTAMNSVGFDILNANLTVHGKQFAVPLDSQDVVFSSSFLLSHCTHIQFMPLPCFLPSLFTSLLSHIKYQLPPLFFHSSHPHHQKCFSSH